MTQTQPLETDLFSVTTGVAPGGGTTTNHTTRPFRGGGSGAGGPSAAQPVTTRNACVRCWSYEYIDFPIHKGQSVRRDCAKCGTTAGFPVWYGEPNPKLDLGSFPEGAPWGLAKGDRRTFLHTPPETHSQQTPLSPPKAPR